MLHWLTQSADAHPDLMAGVPPRGLLNVGELRSFAVLKTPKRRQDWLLGRWTAKLLAQTMIRKNSGISVPLDGLTVQYDPSGAPRLSSDYGVALPEISISHSNQQALAAAHMGTMSVGADIERIETRKPQFVDDYFTPPEVNCVQLTEPALRDLVVTAIWSAKEAALKTLRLGLSIDTRAVMCLITPPAEPPRTWESFEVVIDGTLLQAPAMRGWWRAAGTMVLTLCVPGAMDVSPMEETVRWSRI